MSDGDDVEQLTYLPLVPAAGTSGFRFTAEEHVAQYSPLWLTTDVFDLSFEVVP